MTWISIREQARASGGPNATLGFDDGETYPLTITDPFSVYQHKLLEWYFEERARCPFSGQAEAQKAAQSIGAYGEALFGQVFADPPVYERYKEALKLGVESLSFEIVGSPDFQELHWEALKDPALPQPLALHAPIVRRNLASQAAQVAPLSSPTINLLIVSARPGGAQSRVDGAQSGVDGAQSSVDGAQDVGYRTLQRPLLRALRQLGPPMQIDVLRPGVYSALVEHLQKVREQHGSGYYHAVHLDVHGALLTYEQLLQGAIADHDVFPTACYGRDDVELYAGRKAFFFLEGTHEGWADPVEAGELANLLLTHQIPLVILSACQAGKRVGEIESRLASRLADAGAPAVLAMAYGMTASAAKLMMGALYNRLFAARPLSAAVRRARRELYSRKERRGYFDQALDLEDWLLPVLYLNQDLRLQVRNFTPVEGAAYYERQAEHYREPRTSYGFVGRDREILQIEKHLLGHSAETGHNLLLLRGIGGVGKTTVLHHLGAWWQSTGFVEQVFYFGYDEWAWTRQQIMARIAKKLLGEAEYARSFQPLSPRAQQAALAQRLRARRHLLILDNLESVTGAHLAIRNTLPRRERAALRGFLADLVGGKTLVLLGSRGGEEWLTDPSEAPLRLENLYKLPGLDPEAASILADRVLVRQRATHYLGQPELERLLALLDGHPLALEVVLANLDRQTPAQMLDALQASGVAPDQDAAREKTRSILRCVDYSHSKLSPDAQGLLLCLAPFKSVVWEHMLDQYTARLWEQPALSDLPFERWSQVLKEAADWGLLDSSDISGFWHLQPILPYFLRQRLFAPGQSEVRQAIEAAFCLYYDKMGHMMAQLMTSQDEQEKKLGQTLAQLEYDNLYSALNLSLGAQTSVANLYRVLSLYLDSTREHDQGLELSRAVLAHLQALSGEELSGPLGAEYASALVQALRTFEAAKDSEHAEIALRNLARLWQASDDASLPASITPVLGLTPEQVEQRLRELLAPGAAE